MRSNQPSLGRIAMAGAVSLVLLVLCVTASTNTWRVILAAMTAAAVGAAIADLTFDSGLAHPWLMPGQIDKVAPEHQRQIMHPGTLGNMMAGTLLTFVGMRFVHLVPNAVVIGHTAPSANAPASLTVVGLLIAFAGGLVATVAVCMAVDWLLVQAIKKAAGHIDDADDRTKLLDTLCHGQRPELVGDAMGPRWPDLSRYLPQRYEPLDDNEEESQPDQMSRPSGGATSLNHSSNSRQTASA